MDLSLTFTDDSLPAVTALAATYTRADLHHAMFTSVSAVLRTHFEDLATQRHRPANTTANFYADAAQSLREIDLSDTGFTVAIDQPGVAQRYYGGTLNPTNAKMLTIPASPAALGHRAGDFTNLRCIFFRGRDLGALVEKPGPGTLLDEQGRPPVLFWLKRSVTQAPDPSVLPDPATLQAAAYQAADAFLSTQWQDPAAPTNP